MTADEKRRDHFRAWMREKGLKPSVVSRAAGIPATTLYGYLRGDTATLKGSLEASIAQVYNDTVERIFGGKAGSRIAPVMGKIGARAVVLPLDETQEPMYEVDLPPNLDDGQSYIAFEVDGLSMPPARPGWVILFRKANVPIEDLIGFPCMVDLADGQRLFKDLRRGYTPGRFNLVSWDGGEPLEDQDVVAALPFAAMTPGKMRR